MFTLINEMGTAIKINISIIFGIVAHLTRAKFNCLGEGPIPSRGGKNSPPHTWKGVKSITFCGVVCIKRVSPHLL